MLFQGPASSADAYGMTSPEPQTVTLATIVATERREQERRLREVFVKRDRRLAERRAFDAYASIEAR